MSIEAAEFALIERPWGGLKTHCQPPQERIALRINVEAVKIRFTPRWGIAKKVDQRRRCPGILGCGCREQAKDARLDIGASAHKGIGVAES